MSVKLAAFVEVVWQVVSRVVVERELGQLPAVCGWSTASLVWREELEAVPLPAARIRR